MGLGAVCPAWLSEGVSSPIASVVVAIIVRLDGWDVPKSGVELAHRAIVTDGMGDFQSRRIGEARDSPSWPGGVARQPAGWRAGVVDLLPRSLELDLPPRLREASRLLREILLTAQPPLLARRGDP